MLQWCLERLLQYWCYINIFFTVFYISYLCIFIKVGRNYLLLEIYFTIFYNNMQNKIFFIWLPFCQFNLIFASQKRYYHILYTSNQNNIVTAMYCIASTAWLLPCLMHVVALLMSYHCCYLVSKIKKNSLSYNVHKVHL